MTVCPFLLANPNAVDAACREDECELWVPTPKFDGTCALARIAQELRDLAATVGMMRR